MALKTGNKKSSIQPRVFIDVLQDASGNVAGVELHGRYYDKNGYLQALLRDDGEAFEYDTIAKALRHLVTLRTDRTRGDNAANYAHEHAPAEFSVCITRMIA